MSKRALLYTRVSTDEQNNGYSPLDQRDRLYQYCEKNGIQVVNHYHDDASGKTFDRPEWKKLKAFLHNNQGTIDEICFLKWDRFSRNATLAHAEVAKLLKAGIEPVAINQPVDFKVPEHKVILSIYLITPEMENDRRSMNINDGMRKAKRLGRWLGSCPRGYRFSRDEKNKTIIIPESGEKERLVKLAFSEFGTGQYHIEELRKKLWKMGLKCARNTFWSMLRNKVYIGKVYLKAEKGEQEEWIVGLHPPLIEERLFYEVQDILNGRKKKSKPTNLLIRDEFPLRGFLECPQCGEKLTASLSKGKMGVLYPYYHCKKGCKERQKAEDINMCMEKLLQAIEPRPDTLNLFNKIVQDKLKDRKKNIKSESDKKVRELEKQKTRLSNARTLMLDGEIDAADYRSIKEEVEKKIMELQSELESINGDTRDFELKVKQCLSILSNISEFYASHDTVTKRRIVSSIFPEKLIFDEKKSRTLQVNPVVGLICSLDKGFGWRENEKHTDFGVLSRKVIPTGIEPVFKV